MRLHAAVIRFNVPFRILYPKSLISLSQDVTDLSSSDDDVPPPLPPPIAVPAGGVVCAPKDDATMRTAWLQWRREIDMSLEAIDDCARAMLDLDGNLNKDGNLALVEWTDPDGSIDLHLVHWTLAARKEGRSLRVDDRGGIVYAPPTANVCYPVRSYSEATIVHPNIGVRMLKERRAHRPILPRRAPPFRSSLEL